MNSAFSFKDNIALANGKFLNFIDTNNIRKDVIGLVGSNDLHIKSVGGNVIINDGNNSITYLNTNNSSPVIVNSKLSIGFTTNESNDNLLTLNKNGLIGVNSDDGYLGIIGSINSTSGSKILLHGQNSVNQGSLQLLANSTSGNIEMFTDELKRFSILNNGNISMTPNGSNVILNITNTDTEIDNQVTIYNLNNSVNPTTGGALTVKGGASIEKDLYVGGVLYVDDLSSFTLTSEILTTASLKLSDTTDATSTTDGGPLTVAGGAAVAKNFFVGGSIMSSYNSFTFSGSIRSFVDETSSPTEITGLKFTDILVRSFTATISISVNKSDNSKVYRVFEVKGIKSFTQPNGWLLTTSGSGDSLNYTFTIEIVSGIAQLYYQSPGITNFQLFSLNYSINCITNIDALLEIPHSIRPQTFGLEDQIIPNGIIVGNSNGTHVLTTSKLTFDGSNMNITGNIIPTEDLVYNLGSPTKQWNDLYLAGNTIHLGPCKLSANVNSSDSCTLNFTSKNHQKTHLYLDGYTISKMGNLSCSDERLKSNIKPLSLENTLDVIRQLSPKQYNIKNNSKRLSYGFLAQDLQKVIPNTILKTQTVIPLSSTTGYIENNMLNLTQPLILDEIKQLNNKYVQIQVDDKKYHLEILYIHSPNKLQLKSQLDNTSKLEVKINGYLDNNVLHVEKDSLYTMAIGAIKEIDKLLQNEIEEHNNTKRRLDHMEKHLNQLLLRNK